MLEPLERYMTPTLDAALLSSSKAGADLGPTSNYRQIIITSQMAVSDLVDNDNKFISSFSVLSASFGVVKVG